MAKLNEFAKDYEPIGQTKNIADLPEVSVDIELEDDTFEFTDKATGQPKTVTQKVLQVDGEKYRVPVSVLNALKMMILDNPNLTHFKVKKQGKGFDTRYTVIPL